MRVTISLWESQDKKTGKVTRNITIIGPKGGVVVEDVKPQVFRKLNGGKR